MIKDGQLNILGMDVSKRLMTVIGAILLVAFNDKLGLNLGIQEILGIFGLTGTYVIGDSIRK